MKFKQPFWGNQATKKIEVPSRYADEILLFAKLLDSGEIKSINDLLKLNPEQVELPEEYYEPAKMYNGLFNQFWNQVLDRIDARNPMMYTTKSLLKNYCYLVSFENDVARIKVKPPKMLKLCLTKKPDLENAFEEFCHTRSSFFIEKPFYSS